jgi:hypothetical protein
LLNGEQIRARTGTARKLKCYRRLTLKINLITLFKKDELFQFGSFNPSVQLKEIKLTPKKICILREQGLGTLEVIEHALKPFDIVKVLILQKMY